MSTERSEVDDVFALMESAAADPRLAEAAMAAIRALPCWSAPVALTLLPGGLSNMNFAAESGGARYVVRYGADQPDLGVCRANEAAALRAAHAVGVAPAVFHAEGPMIVMEALDGSACAPADLADPVLLTDIARSLRRLHDDAGLALDSADFVFWPYHHGRWYARQIAAHADRLPPPYAAAAAALGAAIDALEEEIGTCRIVFGHGDMVPGNVFRCANGVRFIDLEYAGFAPDLFDLAGLGMNAELGADATVALLTAYYGAVPDADLLRRYGAMMLVASIRETLWCIKKMVADQPVAFDYRIYADMCLNRHERLVAAHATPGGGL